MESYVNIITHLDPKWYKNWAILNEFMKSQQKDKDHPYKMTDDFTDLFAKKSESDS